jgi:ketosteroid isomerase-like protein
MSQENVEVARCALEAWQRDDFETWLSLIDPDVEYRGAVEREVEGGESVYRGHDGARELWGRWHTELGDFEVESGDFRDLGEGRVLHLTHVRWRGAGSGIEFESPLAAVQTVRRGKIVQSVNYLRHQEALEAMGLRE